MNTEVAPPPAATVTLLSVGTMIPAPDALNMPPPIIKGWNSERPEFEQIVRDAGSPKFIVEVGSWLGQSALRFMDLCPNAIICCVDTWLGSLDHMRFTTIPKEFGFPLIYRQFLGNISRSLHAHRIYPLPQTSLHGARLIRTLNRPIDLCYIDGSHEPGDPFLDANAYWPLMRAGGTMFGDDADNPVYPWLWDEVQAWAAQKGVPIERRSNFWRVKKP